LFVCLQELGSSRFNLFFHKKREALIAELLRATILAVCRQQKNGEELNFFDPTPYCPLPTPYFQPMHILFSRISYQFVVSIGECLNYLFDLDNNFQSLTQPFQRVYQA
jgi:hypothetical protein